MARWFLIVLGVFAVSAFSVLVSSLFFGFGSGRSFEYAARGLDQATGSRTNAPPPFVVTHLPAPEPLKAIYLTSWVAGTPERRERLVKLVDETELNAVVIDIKDYTGRIAFAVTDPVLLANGAVEDRIKDIKKFIGELHKKGIYVIGRISVFQDSHLAKLRPDLAVHRLSNDDVWADRKGVSWLEVGAEEVWDYTVRLARASYAVGFDELNFDYIRFPSDGDTRDITYRFLKSEIETGIETRARALGRFFSYLRDHLADLAVPLSADLFGLTTTALDDLGIGQVLVEAASYFDYLAPMVYPSHFAPGFLNYKNPAAYPYEVVKYTLSEAGNRLLTASSTRTKLRPWLQNFDLGATYDADKIRAQIRATYDSDLTSWMLWDPANRYTPAALERNEERNERNERN